MIGLGTRTRTGVGGLATLAVLLIAPGACTSWDSAQEVLFSQSGQEAIPSRTLVATAASGPTRETIANHPTWIYTPGSALSNGRHGLLVALHGCAQSADEVMTSGNLTATAEAKGLVLAVPDVGAKPWPGSASRCWNYDRGSDGGHHVADMIDLANTLITRDSLAIDPAHVYVVGLSSGAALSLLLGCQAPDVFAGVGAIAGPSVGSAQFQALTDASGIPAANVANALGKCKALAGEKTPFFATQVTNIAYGDMDKNAGPNARYPYRAGDTRHPGQYALVSARWSQDNVSVLSSLYGTGAPGSETTVQDGNGSEWSATAGGRTRLGQLVIHNVGHAWPAGTGRPNSVGDGGLWMAQSGLNYPLYIADWLMRNNLRAGSPEMTVNTPMVSGTSLTMTGSASDDGQITRIDTALLQADGAGSFQQIADHQQIPISSGTFSDSYSNLATGWYRVKATATDDASHTIARTSGDVGLGNPPPLQRCQPYTASNYVHVQAGRAYDDRGIAFARGSNQRMGLDNIFVTTALAETASGYYIVGNCP